MKKLIAITVLLAFSALIFSKEVDPSTAKKVGQVFLASNTSSKGSYDLQLVYSPNSGLRSANLSKSATSGMAYFYVFNISNSRGFVIVAGNDAATPILAYSNESSFDPADIPPNAAKWLENYKAQIRYIAENKIESTKEIENQWQRFEQGKGSIKSTTSISPLIQTKWNQAPYYNSLCPLDPASDKRTLTGCVATAMAQVMKFWNYPTNGAGFHSYNHPEYGTISASFGSTTYNWSSMPNTVTSSNNEVATLMFHCGVSVSMDYGIDGSSASTLAVASALKNFFGYASSVQGIYRSSYTDIQWKDLLMTELNNGRPVQYAGTDQTGGHSFVCDGFDVNGLFHFNWGWGGGADGYYSIDMLNPGASKYNSNHRAVIGIQPPAGGNSFDLRLYKNITPSASSITYGQSFSITTNIVNYGTNSFTGDYCAAVLDNSDALIDFVEIKQGGTLPGGYRYSADLVFANSGSVSMLPGSYRVGIFYRPTGGNWKLAANNGSYTNLVQLSVTCANDMELNSSLTVTPGTILTNGQPASVNVNIANRGTTTFTGQYCVRLCNLDGTFAQTLHTLNENGLPPNYTYVSPFLPFNSPAITVDPGTYLLAVMHKRSSGDWQFTGSTYYTNPVKVIVKEAGLQADVFEMNDIISQSFNLLFSFTSNSATVNTTGSNCHNGSDLDYYKVILPSGYNYTINPRLHDSDNSGNGNVYTLDALFSYTIDGTNWSVEYDDVMTGNINVNNGGTVNFMVSPFFSGASGTYLLDLNITRNIVTSIEKNELPELIVIYPNPAKDFITIDLQGSDRKINEIQIINIFGQPVASINSGSNGQVLTIPVSHLSDGMYFLRLKMNDGIITRKIIIKK